MIRVQDAADVFSNLATITDSQQKNCTMSDIYIFIFHVSLVTLAKAFYKH